MLFLGSVNVLRLVIGILLCTTLMAAVNCSGSSRDSKLVQHVVNRGGTQSITGTCEMGFSKVEVNKPVVVTGGATFASRSDRFVFEINTDNVTFDGMTFQGAGVHVMGPNNIQRKNVNFLNNTFRDFTGNGPGAVLWVDPIHTNSKISGNVFQNIWWGGFTHTNSINVCGLNGIGMCNNSNQSLLLHAILEHGGLDKTDIENNKFDEISGNGIKLFANGLSSETGGYIAGNVSISYNVFSYVHRIGIELQSWDSIDRCYGNAGNCVTRETIDGLKVAGNMFYHPAYPWAETYAYSLPLLVLHCVYVNNAAIGDAIGNTTSPISRLGYAFESQPGWGGSGGLGTGIWNGNVVSSDALPGQNPAGWYDSFVTYLPPPQPVYFQNNLLCGPANNTNIGNISKRNTVAQYNYRSANCPSGTGTQLWSSNIQAGWESTPYDRSGASSGAGAWRFYVIATSLPVRQVEFFADDSKTPLTTQEISDVNPSFEHDRKWRYHFSWDTSRLKPGSHTMTATVTDVSGTSKKIESQPFVVPPVR